MAKGQWQWRWRWRCVIGSAEIGVLYFLIFAGRGGRYRWGGGSDDVLDELWGIKWVGQGGWGVRRGESGAAKYYWQFVLTAPCFLYEQTGYSRGKNSRNMRVSLNFRVLALR